MNLGMRVAGILALNLLTACSHAPTSGVQLLSRAIDAAGGEAALRNAGRLIWDGEADVHAGGRDIHLGVRSDIAPLGHVRSETWLREQGPSSMRILELDGRHGWITRDGKREILDQKIAENEYAQYGTYGLMLLVSLRDPAVETVLVGKDADGLQGLRVNHPILPQATLWFDADARLKALTNTVSSAEGGPPLRQRFEFKGSVHSNGVNWPQQISISQDDKPFFELRIAGFEIKAK
ncbi:MAG: hypothetical protein EYC71_06745 [Gammaproteobacteria bacterium]|nr:MAG: hypothetical protein EYC71_06745 [Gammaproteobacteria bacterium]